MFSLTDPRDNPDMRLLEAAYAEGEPDESVIDESDDGPDIQMGKERKVPASVPLWVADSESDLRQALGLSNTDDIAGLSTECWHV